jgi:hypothetical protein
LFIGTGFEKLEVPAFGAALVGVATPEAIRDFLKGAAG